MFSVVLLCAASSLSQAPEDEELRFLRYRSGLKTGKMTIAGEVHAPKNGVAKRKWIKKVWYTPDRFRCDHVALGPREETREVYCDNCERDGYYVYFNEEWLNPAQRLIPLRMQRTALPNGAGCLGEELKFDPRIVGIGTFSIHHYHAMKLTAVIGRKDRSKPVEERSGWRGKEARLVSFHLNHGPFVRFTFVPEYGHSLVRCQLDQTRKGSNPAVTIRQVMEAEPKQHGKARTWFPTKVICEQFENDTLVERYTLEVTDAAFNEPIPPNVFKLSGMDIPPDTPINLLTPGATGSHIWDGKKIAQKQPDFKAMFPDRPPDDSSAGIRAWMAPLSVCLALLGVAAVGAYYYRARSSGANR